MPYTAPFPLEIKHQTLTQQIFAFINDPKHTFGLLFGSVIIISLTIFGILVISQNLSVTNTLEKQDMLRQKSVAEQKQSQDKAQSEKRAKFDSQRKNDLSIIKQALTKFRGTNNFYPQALDILIPAYLAGELKDPETGIKYFYQAQIDQKGFTLRAILSSGEDFSLTGN